jgi:large subunit ribosomal protein L10
LAISKERKTELVAQYVEMLERSQLVVLTDYRGMNMGAITELRNKLREKGSVYTVTKNTLFKRALEQCHMAVPEALFDGPVAASFVIDDMQGTIKVLLDEAKRDDLPLEVKGGILGESALSAGDLDRITDLPSEDVLRAQLIGLISSPATNIVSLLETPARDLVGVLRAASTDLLNVIAAYAAKEEGDEAAA